MASTSFILTIQSLLFFFFGCSIGSFINVLIDRIPRRESVIKGRSHCDSCKHWLAWYDLFPLFSFIFLKGRCRYCKKKIGWQAFLMELCTGMLFAYTAYLLTLTAVSPFLFIITLVYTLCIISCFIVVSIIDIKHGILPNVFIYPATLFTVLYHLIFISSSLPYFLSGIGAGCFFLLLFLITRGRGMGFGDVKLALLMGLFLGFPHIVIALYIAFLTGALVAFILVISKKKKFSGGTIPFGPFLIAGTLLAFYFGDFLWTHVLKVLFNL